MNNKEYVVNEYITLKLEGTRTIIYINEKKFLHCKYLLIDITPQNITDFDRINSIDEASIILDHSLEDKVIIIPPETEFWGHCSNLHAWADNDYDLRLIHSNLGRSLLKKLTEAGDSLAKAKFKEEILKKFNNCEVIYIYFD